MKETDKENVKNESIASVLIFVVLVLAYFLTGAFL
jgi:hypothetical protein